MVNAFLTRSSVCCERVRTCRLEPMTNGKLRTAGRTRGFAMKKRHSWLLATIGIFAAGSVSAQTDSIAQQIGKLQDQVEVLQREIQRIKAKVGKAESNAQPVVAPTPTNTAMGKVAAVAPTAIATMSPDNR